MNTFDKVILLVQGAAVALTGATILESLPKWLAITAVATNGACLAYTARSTHSAALTVKALRRANPPASTPST